MPDDRIKKLMSYLNSQVEEKKEEKEQAKADAPVKATEKAKLPKIPLTENVKNSIFAPATTPAPFPNATPEATKMYTLQQDKEKEVRNELRGESIDPLQVKDKVKLLEQREGIINQNSEGTAILNTPHYKENYQKRYDDLNEEFKNIYEQSTELEKQLKIKETPELINKYNELIERNNYLQREWKGLEQENQAFIKAADKLLVNNYSKYVNDKVAEIQKTQKELGYNYYRETAIGLAANSMLGSVGQQMNSKIMQLPGRKLEAAKSIYQDSQKLINAPSKTQGIGLFNFTEEVGGALISERFWRNLLTLEGKNIEDNIHAFQSIKLAAEGKPLTKEDELIMDALLTKTIIAAQREGNLSIGYQGAEMFVEAIPFMLSFLFTAGVSSGLVKGSEKVTQKAIYNYAKNKLYNKLGKEATDAAIKKAEAELMYRMSTSKLAKYVPKIAGVATDMTVGSAIRTPIMPTSYSQFTQNITPTVVAKQNGGYKTEAGMTPLQALGDVYIEVLSESSGSMFTGAAGILGKIVNKTPLKNFINSAAGSRLGTALFNREGIMNRAGFNGLISESLEEYFGNAARYVTGVIDKEEFKDFYKWDNQASMIVSFAAMSGIGLIPNEVRRAKAYFDYKNNINNLKQLGFDDTGIAEINDLINKTSPKDIPIALANFAIDKQIIQGGEELTTEDQKSLNNLLTYSLAYIQKKGLNNSIQAQNPDIPFGAEVKGTTVSVVNGMGEVLHQNTYISEAKAKAIAEELNTKIQNIHEEQEAKQDIVDATIEANNPTRSDDGNLYEFTVTEDKPLPTNNYKPKLPNGKLVSVHLISSPEDINEGKVVVVREKYITTNKEGETEIQVADNTVSAEVAKEIFNNSETFAPDTEREIANAVAEEAILKAKIQEIEQTNKGFFVRSPTGGMILVPVGEYQIVQASEYAIVLELEDGTTKTTSFKEQGQVQEVVEKEKEVIEQEEATASDRNQSPPIATEEKQATAEELDPNNPEHELLLAEQEIGVEQTIKEARGTMIAISQQVKALEKKKDKKTKLSDRREIQKEITDLQAKSKIYAKYILDNQKQIEGVQKPERKKQQVTQESSTIQERWDNAPKYIGFDFEKKLPDGTVIKGRYVLTEQFAATPSHNPLKGFKQFEGFPTDEKGQTVNSRDYESNDVLQKDAEYISSRYDLDAIQNAPSISKGVVVDGNKRTQAGMLAAVNGTSQKYLDALNKYARNYGFTQEQIKEFEHPRLFFEITDDVEFTTEFFDRFNDNEKASENKQDVAIKLSKQLQEEVIVKIANVLNKHEKLSEVYNDPATTDKIMHILLDEKLINTNDVSAMLSDDKKKFSGTGSDFVEALVIGSVLNPKAVKVVGNRPSLKQAILTSIVDLLQNAKLDERYTLKNEINEACVLAYEAMDKKMTVAQYMSQKTLDFVEDPRNIYSITVRAIAEQLRSEKYADFRKFIKEYNGLAIDFAQGQSDVFFGGRILTKNEIIAYILNINIDGQEFSSTEQVRTDDSGNGKRKNQRGQKQETSVDGSTEKRGTEGRTDTGSSQESIKDIAAPTEPATVEPENIKEGVSELFESNPELAKIGTPEQYSQYLDTIFPDSKVKDIVYHNTKEQFETFDKSKLISDGFYFTPDNKAYKHAGKIKMSVLLDLKNPITDAPGLSETINKPGDTKRFSDLGHDGIIDLDGLDEYIVFEPEQIHILGSKQDIEGFKKFVTQPTTQSVKSGVSELFEQNPDLATIGTQQQYSQYLDIIFPDSKVKNIVYHGSREAQQILLNGFKIKQTKYKDSIINRPIWFGTEKEFSENSYSYGNTLLFNIINTIKTFNPKIISEQEKNNFVNKVVEKIGGKENNIRYDFFEIEPVWHFYTPEILNILKELGYDSFIEYEGWREDILKSYENIAVFEPEQIHILGSKQDIEGFKAFAEGDIERRMQEAKENPVPEPIPYKEAVEEYKSTDLGSNEDAKRKKQRVVDEAQTKEGIAFVENQVAQLETNDDGTITVYRSGTMQEGHNPATTDKKTAELIASERKKQGLSSDIIEVRVQPTDISAIIPGIESEVFIKIDADNKNRISDSTKKPQKTKNQIIKEKENVKIELDEVKQKLLQLNEDFKNGKFPFSEKLYNENKTRQEQKIKNLEWQLTKYDEEITALEAQITPEQKQEPAPISEAIAEQEPEITEEVKETEAEPIKETQQKEGLKIGDKINYRGHEGFILKEYPQDELDKKQNYKLYRVNINGNERDLNINDVNKEYPKGLNIKDRTPLIDKTGKIKQVWYNGTEFRNNKPQIVIDYIFNDRGKIYQDEMFIDMDKFYDRFSVAKSDNAAKNAYNEINSIDKNNDRISLGGLTEEEKAENKSKIDVIVDKYKLTKSESTSKESLQVETPQPIKSGSSEIPNNQSEAKPSAIKSIASEIKNETDFDRLEREYKKAEAHYRVLQNRYDKLRDEANGKQQTLFDEGTQESLFGGEEFKKESQEILSKAKHDVDVAEQEYSKLKTAYEQEVSNQRIGQQGIDFEATTEVKKEEKEPSIEEFQQIIEETQQNENNNVNIKNEEHGNENITNVSGVLHADNKDVSKGERAKSVPSVHKRRTKQISKETSGTLFGPDGEQQPSDVGEGSVLQGNADVLEEQNEKVKQEPVFVPFNPQENDTETFNSLVKYQDNIAALETLNTLLRENRKATAQEKEILSKYVGFGGLKDILYNPELPEVFKESNSKYIPYIKRIIELSKEFDTLAGVKNSISNIKASTANAHFTGSTVINAIYKGISKIGFKGGRILEPSAGTGNFITYMPAKIKGKSHINAVELDDITGNILKYLHDDITTHVMGIQDAKIPNNSQDLIISNVPFGNYKIYDKNLSKEAYPFQNRIHNYFFAKAIDKAREGGIIAFITSKGVLDSKSNEDLRKYLNDKADFLGAVRLPNTAFKNNANTEVVTDIIFFKKNSGIKNNADFVGVSEVKATHKDGEEQNVSVNNYFISHPENMLGDIVAGGLYSRADYTLIDNNSASQLGKVIEDMLPGGVYQEVSSNLGLQANDVTEQIEKIKEGNIAFVDDKLIKKLGNEIIPIEINEPKEKIKLYIDIRNSLMDLIYSEYIGKEDKVLSEKRATLNNLYDNYVSKYGTLNSSLKRIAKQDGDIYNALALEFKENNRYVKADIFKKRTINPIKEKNHAENIEEAIIISLSERASIDIERIAELLQMSIPEVLELSRGKLYEEPSGGYVTAEEYLSGNVKEKLRQAQAAVDAGYINFQYNVDNLTHVIPKDIPTLQIEARMGSRWIPQEVYSAYARHLFKDESINITYIHSTDDYSHSGRVNTVEATNRYGTSRMNGLDIFVKALVINPPVIKDKEGAVDKAATELAKEKYDEIRESFVDWVYKTEDRRELLGRVYNEKFNNTVKRTYNGDHLAIPGIKGVNLYQHQKDTVWRLLQNNGGIVDHIVGSGKTFIMIATTMEMRRTGVAKKPMIIALKSTIPQIVETYRDAYPMAKILAPMEKDFEKKNRMRLFSQIANNEWDCIIMSHENYGKIPHETDIEKKFINEEILEIEAERGQLEADGNKAALKGLETRLKNLRAKLDALSNIKKDNLITFEQMGIDHLMVDESQQFKNLAYVTKQRGIAGLGSNVGSKRAFNLYIGCRYLQGKYEADKGITFLSGTPISNSMAEMYLLLKYFRPNKLNELGFNTFDTWASTFANPTTDVEFTVTGEFKPKTRFREFINVPELSTLYTEIADIRTDDNLKLDKPKMKDNGYTIVNMPMNEEQEEFSKQLIEFAKTKDGHKIGLGNLSEKKKKAYMLIVTNLSSKMAIDMRLIDKNKYNYDPNGKIGRLVDNIVANYRNSESFKGTQLVFSDIGTPKGKGGMAAKLRDYLEDEHGVDIDTTNEIFGDKSQDSYKIAPMYTVRSKMEDVMDLSREEIDELIEDAEKAEASFNLYDEVKLRLIEKGIPEEQIVFIHSYNTNRQKEALFDKVNAGEIRIVLGSTQKLGTGVNAQKKLIAIHHLDVPWKPSDMEQRNGRGLRQGNKAAKEYLNNELPVYAYATERTLDGYKYQLLQIKQRFLTQVKTGDIEDRVLKEGDEGDSGVGFAEFVAIMTGNEDILIKGKLEELITKLKRQKRNFFAEIYEAEEQVKKLNTTIPIIEQNILKSKENIISVTNTIGKDKEGKFIVKTINGKELKGEEGKEPVRSDYAKEVLKIIKDKLNKASLLEVIPLVTINNHQLIGHKTQEITKEGALRMTIERSNISLLAPNGQSYNVRYSDIPGVFLNNIQNAIENIPNILAMQEKALEKSKKDLIAYNEILKKGTEWEKEGELTKAQDDLKVVTERLNPPKEETKEQEKEDDNKIRIGDIDFTLDNEGFISLSQAKKRDGSDIAVVRINEQLKNEDYAKKVKPLIDKHNGEWNKSNKVIIFNSIDDATNFRNAVFDSFYEEEEPTTAIEEISDMFKNGIPAKSPLVTGEAMLPEKSDKLLPVEEFVHTHTGQTLYNVKINGRTDEYEQIAAMAKTNNPYNKRHPYSNFSKGFLFEKKEDANKFRNSVNGEVRFNLSKEDEIEKAIQERNDGNPFEVVSDINGFLKEAYKGVQRVIDKIKEIERSNQKIRGIYANRRIVVSSNQTVEQAVSTFEHERQHVENKTDKEFISIQQNIIDNVDYNELEREVALLSNTTGYNGVDKRVLADEYIAYTVQHFHDKTGFKSSLEYQKIIEDEYKRKNEDRLYGNRGNLYGNRNAGESHAENNRESKDRRNLLSGSVQQAIRGEHTGEEGQRGGINFLISGEKGAAALDNAEEAATRMINLEVAKKMEQMGIKPYFEAYKTARKKIDELNEQEDYKMSKRKSSIQDIEKMYNALGYKVDKSDRDIHKAFIEAYEQNDISLLPKAKGNLLIKLATGWERGADSKWRYEIPDVDTTKLEKKIKKNKDKYDEGTGIATYLGEYIDNDSDVFKAFPELKDIDLIISVKESNKNTGSYRDKIPKTEIEFGNPPIIKIEASSIGEVKYILIHEIQHAIQSIEGFARGGNLKNAAIMVKLDESNVKSIEELQEKIRLLRKEMNKVYSEWYNKAFFIRYKGQKAETSKLLNEWQKIEKEIKRLESDEVDTRKVIQKYRSISGEVESRNAELRTFMDDVEKLNTLLSETEDISREDQIFLGDAVSDLMFNLAPTSDLGFYSTVENALLNIKQDKGTREQFKAMLLKNGAKQAELDWMGFDELPEKLTKSDIQEWIDENRIEVQEVEKGGMKPYITKDNVTKVVFSQHGRGQYLVYWKQTEVYNEGITEIGTDQADDENEAIEEAIKRVNNSDADYLKQATKYSDSKYQLPGGENYKELLLTMPDKSPKLFTTKVIGNKWFVIDSDGKIASEPLTAKFEAEEIAKRRTEIESGKKINTFKSSHYSEPNILAHVRFNERTGANGERILFIEEIQSDWAQEGKKKGFKTDKLPDNVKIKEVGGNWQVIVDGRLKGEYKTEQRAKETAMADFGGVPSMPFQKTDQWVNLALRRMMRYAAENGFDRIAWTNGEQQAARYDLSKSIDKVYYNPNTKEFGYFVKGEKTPEIKTKTEPTDIENYIGKDATKKLLDSPLDDDMHEIEGDDLKVGGSGMKAFYDAIVPSAMSKLGKPFNAKVETIKMDIGEQQSIPITESMKESVMEGMPLFNLQSLPDLQKQRAEAALRKYNAKDYPEMKAAMQDIKRLAEEITAAGETPYTNDDLEKIVSFVTSYNFTIDEAINAIEYSLSPTVAILGSKMRVAVVKKYRSLKLNAKHKELKDAIKDAVDFAKTITDDKTWGEWKLMDEKKRIIIKQVLTQIKNAASKKDINKELDKMFDVLIERQNQVAREVLKKLFDMKISDTSGKGIRVGKNVDDQTRVILSTIKGNMNKSTDKLSEQIADLNDELEQTTDEIKIGELKAKIYGLETSLMYQERVLETQEQIQSIVEEIEKETDKTNKKALNGLLREERSTLQNHLEFFINEIHKIINKGIEERQSFLNNQREHKKEILHDAARDLKNVKIHVNQEVNRSQLRKAALAITNPVRSFSTMLKEIGKYFPEGKGALYDRFVREGILKSVRNEYLGIEAVQNKLKADIKAIFGDKHSLEKLRVFAEKDNVNTIEVTRNGVTENLQLKNGQLMYIYMVNKMHDGRMKLDEMGISALDVERMATSLPDNIIEFCDYIQEDLLPSLRAKYNKTHVELFGIQMDEIENYFPLKIAKEVVRQNVDVEAPEQSLMPTNATGAIIRRKRNKKTLDIKNSNAIDVLQAHIKEMEYWNAHASMIQDLNTLNASLFFKNKLNALSDGMATRFFELSQIALKKYNSKRSDVDEFAMKASKFIAVSKIALRLNTAIKQILSFVAYFSQADPSFYKYGLKNMINFTESNITWGMENLPLFKERWKSRTGGDDRLSLNKEKLSTMGRFFNKVANIGLVPNAAVDLLACAFGAKTMYDTKYNRYLEMGFDEETAKSKALIDAEIIYNETQQSQEALFLSKVQSDRTFLGAAFSLFNNASFAYGRQLTEGLRGVKAFATNKELMIENQTKKFIREGLTPENAAKFAKIEVNRSVRGDVLKIGIFGYLVQVVWNFGSDNSVAQSISNIVTMLFGDDDDKEVLKEEKQTELKKALLLGTITPIRGLIGGKELETLVNMTAEGFQPQYVSGAMRSTPLGSDIMGLYEDLMEGYNKSDWKLIANSLLALGTSFTGTNINTIYNSIFSIYDLTSTSDITVHDVAYDLSLLINAPKSDQKELSLIRKEGKNLEEYIQRYVRLKRLHKYGVFSGLQNKEKEAEEISKIINGEKSDMFDKKTIKREAMNVVKVVNVEYQDLKETIKEVKDANKEAKEKGKDKAYKTNTRAYNDAVNVLDKYGDDFKERILTKREISIIKKATDNLRKEIE